MNNNKAYVQLSDVSDIVMGQSPDSDFCNTKELGLPFLQGCAEFSRISPITEIYCDPPLRIAKSESVLISVRAPVGKMNWSDQKYCIGRGLAAISEKPGLSVTHFIQYALAHNVNFLHKRSQGSTFLAIGSNDLNIFPIPNFSFDIQTKITEILRTIDQAIEKTQELIEKYQQIKAGLMHDLFTRGVTADGKLRPPREEAPELYHETPSGWVPKEWGEVQPINDLLDQVIDYRGKTPTKTESGIPLITAKNVRKGYIDPIPREFIALNNYSSWMTRGIPLASDILFTTEAPLGNVAQVGTTDQIAFAQRVIILRPTKEIRPTLLKYKLLSDEFSREVNRKASGTTALGIKQSEFRKVFINFPKCPNEQKFMERYLVGADDRLNIEKIKKKKLMSMKKGLLHDLLTGLIKVDFDKNEAINV